MALYGYSNTELAVMEHARSYYASYLPSAGLVGNDITAVVKEIVSTNSDFGIVFSFVSAAKYKPENFRGTIWQYLMSGMILQRYNELNGESQLRTIIDSALLLLESNQRLSGNVEKIELMEISTPQPYKIGERAFYYIPLVISVLDKI